MCLCRRRDHYALALNYTYMVTCSVYLLMAVCGYLAYGNLTQQEVRTRMRVHNLKAGIDSCAITVLCFRSSLDHTKHHGVAPGQDLASDHVADRRHRGHGLLLVATGLHQLRYVRVETV